MVRGEPSDQRRAVERALEAGINFFDTADSYGRGQSEQNLGRVLGELGASPFIATKVTRSDVELAADGGAAVRQSLEQSLQRLGRDHVDLFLLHGRVAADGGMSVERVIGPIAEAMVAVREAGLTRLIGFNGLGDTKDLHKVAHLGVWDAAHCYVNAINPTAGWKLSIEGQQDFRDLIGHCDEHGVAPIAIRMLAAGALAGDVPRHPIAGGGGRAMIQGGEYERDLERARSIQLLASELGLEGALELSLRFVLSHPQIATGLVGLSSLDQLEDAIRWAERGPLDDSSVQRVLDLHGGVVEKKS